MKVRLLTDDGAEVAPARGYGRLLCPGERVRVGGVDYLVLGHGAGIEWVADAAGAAAGHRRTWVITVVVAPAAAAAEGK
jgi:hypothetical protein